MDEKQPPSLADLQTKLAILMERMTNLAILIDDRFQGMKRMHERVDRMEDSEKTLIKIEVKLTMLEKLVYTSLLLSVTGVGTVLWFLVQKVLKL